MKQHNNSHRIIALCLVFLAGAYIGFAEAPDPTVPTDRSAFDFGESPEATRLALADRFETLSSPTDQPLEVPTATESQQQIDGTGDAQSPWSTKTELIFANGALEIVWVLTSQEVVVQTLARLAEQGIEPSHSIPGAADFFLDRGFAVRYEPVEFLYFSERIAPFYEGWLESME